MTISEAKKKLASFRKDIDNIRSKGIGAEYTDKWLFFQHSEETIELIDRETKLTDAEFASLDRTSEGVIIGDFDFVWLWATPAQKDKMHSDDIAFGARVDEELRYMYLVKYVEDILDDAT